MHAVEQHLSPESLMELALPAAQPQELVASTRSAASREAVGHALLQLQALASLARALMLGPGTLEVGGVRGALFHDFNCALDDAIAPKWLCSPRTRSCT